MSQVWFLEPSCGSQTWNRVLQMADKPEKPPSGQEVGSSGHPMLVALPWLPEPPPLTLSTRRDTKVCFLEALAQTQAPLCQAPSPEDSVRPHLGWADLELPGAICP